MKDIKQEENPQDINDQIERDLIDNEKAIPPDLLVAMTIWGEARGESIEGKRAVAAVIYNRAAARSNRTNLPISVTVDQVCMAPFQFSCWDGCDGHFLQEKPDLDSSVWNDCVLFAREIFADSYCPFIIATHYYADWISNQPEWAKDMEYICRIGKHLFYFDKNWR